MTEANVSPQRFLPRRTASLLTLFRVAVGVIGFFALIAAVVLLVIYPLWFLATQATLVYTLGCLAIILVLAAVIFLLRWRQAARNSRLDGFFLKVRRVLAYVFFFLAQGGLALINIAYFDFLKNDAAAPAGISAPMVLFHLAGGVAVIVSFLIPFVARRWNLFRRAGFIITLIIIALQLAYWLAAFIFQGAFIYDGVLIIAVLGFFFGVKITKIIRAKKSPINETIH